MESKSQGSRPGPRPRKQKNFKAKDRPSRRQGQGPRTKAQVFSKKKRRFSKKFFKQCQKRSSKFFFRRKRSSKIFFRRFPLEKDNKGLRKFSARFLALSNKISPVQKIVLSSSRGQGNFRGLEASRPRTSKCVLEDVLEAKNVLEDSTSAP